MATITQLREKFDKAISYIDSRKGVYELVSWLNDTDFFTLDKSIFLIIVSSILILCLSSTYINIFLLDIGVDVGL